MVRLPVLPPDVNSFIDRRFPAADQAEAVALLSSAVIHDGSPAGLRLVRCAAVSSRGSLETLRSEVARLKIDWRDVIVSGEYEVKEGKLVHARNLNGPIAEDL